MNTKPNPLTPRRSSPALLRCIPRTVAIPAVALALVFAAGPCDAQTAVYDGFTLHGPARHWIESVTHEDQSVSRLLVFRTVPGVEYTVESSPDLQAWTTVESHYGLGQEVAVSMIRTDPPAAPPPPPAEPLPPGRFVWLIMQPATTGGIVLHWHSVTPAGGVRYYSFQSHHFSSLTLAPEWTNQIIYCRRFGDWNLSISHPTAPSVPFPNTEHSPDDQTMLDVFEANFATMNQEVIDHTVAVRTVPPPVPVVSNAGRKFFRIRADWAADGDGDGSADWMELALMLGAPSWVTGAPEGSGPAYQNSTASLADPFAADANGDGTEDGLQMDLDGDQMVDTLDAHPSESAIAWNRTVSTRYALFDAPFENGAGGAQTVPIGVNSQGMVLFRNGTAVGGAFLPLPASGLNDVQVHAISDSGALLGAATFPGVNGGTARLTSAIWPSPGAAPVSVTDGDAYAHPTYDMATGQMTFSSAFASDGAFVAESRDAGNGSFIGRERWTWWENDGFTRESAPPGALYCAADGVMWGRDASGLHLDFTGPGTFDPDTSPLYRNYTVVGGVQPMLTGTANPPALVLAGDQWSSAAGLRRLEGISETGIALSYDQSPGASHPTLWMNNRHYTLEEMMPDMPTAYKGPPQPDILGMAAKGHIVLGRPSSGGGSLASCAVAVPCAVEDDIDPAQIAQYTDVPGDTVPYTGLDEVSATATKTDPAAGNKIWIMAPIGGSAGNLVRMRVPSGPGNPIALSGDNVSNQIELSADETAVTWLGTGAATSDHPLKLHMGAANPSLSAPIGIKAMKRRQVKVTVVKVPFKKVWTDIDGNVQTVSMPPQHLPTQERVSRFLNKVFETQLNAEIKVTFREAAPLAFSVLKGADLNPPDGDLGAPKEGDRFFDLGGDIDTSDNNPPPGGTAGQTRSPEMDMFIPLRDPQADITVFVVGGMSWFNLVNWYYNPTTQVGGWLKTVCIGYASGATREVWVDGDMDQFVNPPPFLPITPVTDPAKLERRVLATIAHEIGHVIVGDGHPNQNSGPGPAPLPGTIHRERLMYSKAPDNLSCTRLVKGEWDEAEKWFKNRPNGDQ